MQRLLLATVLGLLLTSTSSQASDVGFNVNLNIGNQPAPRAVRAMPVVIDEPPVFLYPPRLGFAVAVDIPYDMVYIEGRYYLYQDDAWLVAPRYDGPWVVVKRDRLPPGLRKHRVREIVDYRDREYVVYRERGHDHGYRGKVYHPGRGNSYGRGDDRDDDHDNGHGRGKHKHKHDD